MTRIAILDERLPAQAREHPEGLEGIELVWAGTDVDTLIERLPTLRPHVLVCDVGLLGPDAGDTLRRLEETDGVELLLVLYQFARREDLASLHGERRRVVQAPLSLARLRSQMMGVVVRQLFQASSQPEVRAARPRPPEHIPRGAPAPSVGARPPTDGPRIPARRYTAEQLGRLAEITTSIDCECPHHLSDLVSSLVAFEDYSARCESRDDEDAAVHRMLWVETAKARAAMEDALAALVAHEKIEV